MGGGHLPDAGGVVDQCSWLLEAFNMMSAFERKLPK